jgi:hypothetical protein
MVKVMSTFRLAIAFTCVIAPALCSIAQEVRGVLGNVDGIAEDYLIDYIAKGEAIHGDYACVGRGANAGMQVAKSIVRDAELWVIEARCGKGASLSAMCRQDYSDGPSGGRPFWEQTLIWDSDRYYRRTTTGTVRGVNISEKVDTPSERSNTRRLLPTMAPYFLPFVESAAYISSRDGLTSAEKFLVRFELDEARREDSGVRGVWLLRMDEVARCRVSILFDEKQGNMPAKVTWEFPARKKGKGDDPEFIVRMASETKWSLMSLGQSDDVEKRWLPRSVHRIDYLGANTVSEMTLTLKWGRIEKKDFPLPSDEDWRSPFALKFGIDWNEPYQSFVRRYKEDHE